MEFETEMHLCARFTLFAKRFKMMSADNFIISENFTPDKETGGMLPENPDF
jgi:hypothetical protein